MLTVDLARQLRDVGGLLWSPRAGDRFVIDAELLTGDLFWISDLTVETQSFSDQTLLGFNGTTEWALDSVTLDQALWLPREDQLRELVGSRFRTLSRADGIWRVDWEAADGLHTTTDPDVECAYARTLLAISGETSQRSNG